jgi:hypothetical protein
MTEPSETPTGPRPDPDPPPGTPDLDVDLSADADIDDQPGNLPADDDVTPAAGTPEPPD